MNTFDVNTTVDDINNTPIDVLIDNAGPIFVHCTASIIEEVWVRVWTHGTENERAKFLENQFTHVHTLAVANGGSLETCAGDTENDMCNAVRRAAQRIEKDWGKDFELKSWLPS